MNDILNDGPGLDMLSDTPQLSDLVDMSTPVTSQAPEGSVRNRAAISALIQGDPNKVASSYQMMMQEAAQGQETTHKQITDAIANQIKGQSLKGVISVLGNRNIPLDQKRKLLEFTQQDSFKEDPQTTLQTAALSAPSKGEDVRGEAARISTADVLAGMQKERENRQKLINNAMSDMPPASIGMVGDVTTMEVMPFGRNIIGAKVAAAIDKADGKDTSLWTWAKRLVLSGSTKAEIRDKLDSIPPDARENYTKSILKGIRNSGGLFFNDNYYAQQRLAQEMLDDPRASKTAEWADNIMTLMDAYWVSDIYKGVKAGTSTTEKGIETAVKPPVTTPSTVITVPVKSKQAQELDAIIQRQSSQKGYGASDVANQEQIKKLQQEKEGLLGTAGNLSDKGAIAGMKDQLKALEATKPDTSAAAVKAMAKDLQTSEGIKFSDAQKEASKRLQDASAEYEARVNHLNTQIETNRQAAIASQRIDAIDSQIAGLQKGLQPNPGRMNPIADQLRKIKMESPVRQEHAVTPFSIIEQANPAQAREIHKALLVEGEEFAKAMTGVSKEQALVNNTFPQVGTDSGAVLNKVNQDLADFTANTGALRYTPEELNSAIDTVKNDFRNASGMEINDAMTTFHVDGDHMVISAHYSPAGGAWNSAEQAKAQAGLALRKYGIQPEEITVMRRDGMEYIPHNGEPGSDFIVKVETKHPLQDNEVQAWSNLDVKRNWVDRIPFLGSDKKGSLAGMLFDPGSMLHPTLTGSASVATDQAITFETVLLRPIKELRTQLAAMPVARRTKIEEYLVEANTHGLKHDPLALIARGFTQPEIDSMKLWRDIWDGHYYLENFDLVRTLSNQGYQILDTQANRFFAKPVPKNQNIGKVFDPSQNTVRTLTKAEMDDLYNTGGHYAALRRPVNIAGDEISHIMVRNSASEYLRKIRSTDPVLNYREGYYTINYKAPKFIDEITVDAAGKETRRTVGVAGNTADADTFAASRQASTGNRHQVREDARGFAKDSDTSWDLNEASGRIAQRMRGKPLTQAMGVNNVGVGAHIENPMESAVRAANSLAGRTVTRPMLETAKRRFIEQYGEFLKQVPFGSKAFPSSRGEIVDITNRHSSAVADARTTWDYINFLENGYINTADEVFKSGMEILANTFGKMHLSGPERVARNIGEASLSHKAKSTVFHAYISLSNPLRQWLVQSHQVTRTMMYNPIGWANLKIPKQIIGYLGEKSGLVNSSAEALAFTKFVDESGMVAGVDRNSLVRGMKLDMADASYGAKRAWEEAKSIPQRIGFDLGEKMNQLGHLSAVYEKYVRQGKNMADKTVRDAAASEARALSYDLNAAGELHYTQGSAAMVLQFLQMPQKAMLQLTNRRLALGDRLRLAGWDMLMWGAPTATIGAIVTAAGGDGGAILPDDPDKRQMFVDGLEAYALNRMFTEMDDSGQKTNIDFSVLKPNDIDGWAKMFKAMFKDGLMGTLAASPTGQLLAVNGVGDSTRNGRITQALLTTGRFFNVFDEIGPTEPTTFKAVLNDAAKISSGWTAYDNAILTLEAQKKFDSMGVVVDSTVTTPEIMAAFIGLGTRSTKESAELIQQLRNDKKDHEKEVMAKYRDIIRYYKDELKPDGSNIDHVLAVSNALMKTFQYEPKDLELVQKQWANDLMGKEQQLFELFLNASGMPGMKRLEDQIKMWPVDENIKQQMLQRMKDFRAQREFNKGK